MINVDYTLEKVTPAWAWCHDTIWIKC